MHIMCLITFEEKAEIQDQYPLSLNRDHDRLQNFWAIVKYINEKINHYIHTSQTRVSNIKSSIQSTKVI